jgi:hypothetical protein
VLSFLEGHYQRCYDAGNTGMGNGVKIADKAATTIRANRAVYVETDRQAYEKLRKNNPSLPPYQEPKGQLPAGAKTPASGPSTAQRIWDGTKWVTKAVSDGAGQASKIHGHNNQWWNTKNKSTRLDKFGKPVKDGSKLMGADTDWVEDPLGTAKKKVSTALKDKYAQAGDYAKDGKDWDKKMKDEFQEAYKKKSGTSLPDTGTAKNQHTASTLLDAVQKPQEVISTGEGLWKEIQQAGTEIDRAKKIDQLTGTNNKGSTEWANNGGGTW